MFTTEHQGDLLASGRTRDALHPAFARVEHRPRHAAVSGAGTNRQTATGQRLLERIDHDGAVQHIVGTRGAGTGVGRGEIQWLNQHQARQAHVFHGTSSAADVAGVAGIDQNNTNILQQGVELTDAYKGGNDLT